MIKHLFHYFRKGSRPFQSLSALPEAQALRLMETFYVPGSILWQRFGNPAEYLRLRRQVEHQLLRQFREKGGCPRQAYPIYLVVGRPKWAVTAADPVTMETTAEIRVPLSILNDDEVSFTYPDSMFCPFMLLMKQEPDIEPEYRDKVFMRKEMESLIDSRGFREPGGSHTCPRICRTT